MTKNNGLKIMSIQASEILKNNFEGKKLDKKYNAVFSTSMLGDKAVDITGKSKLELFGADKDSTSDVVVLKFDYGYNTKEYKNIVKTIESNNDKIKELQNKIKSIDNLFVKERIEKKKEYLAMRKATKGKANKAVFTKLIDEIAIDIKDVKCKNKDIRDRLNRIIKKIRSVNKCLKYKLQFYKWDSLKVRDYLYNNGFFIDFYKKDADNKYTKDTRKYFCYWFRTTSKSRIGESTFCKRELFEAIDSWQNMDIKLDPNKPKIVENEAYKSLTASNIIFKVKIPVKSILVVNDLTSFKDELCTRVFVNDNGNVDAETKNMTIKNVLFDGMALLDDSVYIDDSSMYLLRNHYTKMAGFRTNIKQFMKDIFKDDYETATLMDRYGNDILVKDILCITSENSMKWEKLNSTYDKWKKAVIADGEMFGVCKEEHPSKLGKYQKLSYQHVNSLPTDFEGMKEICQTSINYLEGLKTNLDLFLEHIERTACRVNSNQMFADLIRHSKGFIETETFRKFRSEVVNKYKEELISGNLIADADNLTMVGNPYILLLHSIGQVPYTINNEGVYVIDKNFTDPTLPILEDGKGISIYTNRFDDGEQIALFRNPHNSMNNIILGNNCKHKLMDTYFIFSKNICACNNISTNCQDRANSMDFDSDFCLGTREKAIVQASIEAQKFPTIVNDIEKENIPYNDTMSDRALIDHNLAKGKFDIGLTSNLAMLALSWYNKAIIEGDTVKAKKLLDVVCISSVLAQVAIDNSKRKYAIVLSDAIKRIRNLDCMMEKKTVTITKDGKEIAKQVTAKPFFWQNVKDVTIANLKVKDFMDKAVEELAKENGITVKEYKLHNKNYKVMYAKAKELKKAKQIEKTKEKKEKVNDIKLHCLEEKICNMDYLEEILSVVKDMSKGSNYKKEAYYIKKIEGKSEKNRNKIKDLVTELDRFYIDHFKKKDDIDNNIILDEDEWFVEQDIKVTETFNKIAKFKLTEKTMQMLILDAFTQNTKLKRRMLNCLYNTNQKMFLDCFYKSK